MVTNKLVCIGERVHRRSMMKDRKRTCAERSDPSGKTGERSGLGAEKGRGRSDGTKEWDGEGFDKSW